MTWTLVRGKTNYPWQFEDREGAENFAKQLNEELLKNYARPYKKMTDVEALRIIEPYKAKEVLSEDDTDYNSKESIPDSKQEETIREVSLKASR